MHDVRRDTFPAILISLSFIMISYLLCNISYFSALTNQAIMDTNVVAMETSLVVTGAQAAAMVVSALIGLSALGSMFNGTLSGARTGYAAARDGLFPSCIGRLSKNGAPYIAVLVKGGLACVCLLVPGSSLSTLLSFTSSSEYDSTHLSLPIPFHTVSDASETSSRDALVIH